MLTLRNTFFIISVWSLALWSFADTEQRDIDDFTEVAVSGGIKVRLVQASEFSVEVEADDTDDIVTEVVGDTLRLYRDNSWDWNWFGSLLGEMFFEDGELTATVALPQLARVRTSGGADVRSDSTFTGNNLELQTSGGSSIVLAINYDALEAVSSGGSRLRLSGTVNHAKMQSSGGSRQNAESLVIKTAELRASGGSDLNIGSVENLTARASGGADIRYEGDPRIRDVDESGSGDVTRR